MQIRQKGISPKLVAPILAALTAVVTTWITSGDFDRTQLALLATAVLGAVGAYLVPPGEVTVPDLEALPYDAEEVLDAGDDPADPESRMTPDDPDES